ncbi:MAG: hypothetical protein JXQ94_14220 [Maricaulis maris]
MSVFRAVSAALVGVMVAVMSAVGPVDAQRIPSMGDGAIEDFLRHVIRPPRYENVRLSPNGRYLLMVQKPHHDGGDDTVLVYDLDAEGGSSGRRVSVGNRRVDWVELLAHPRRDRDFMRETLPVHLADQVQIPLYLFHGEADQIVPVEQSHVMAETL